MLQQAKRVKDDIRLIGAELKHQTVLLRRDEFLQEAQCIKLLRELQTIYPITLDAQKGYLIRDLRCLPANMDIYTTMTIPEDELSAALGFAGHLIFLLSKYLSVPLRHRVFCNSSRSAIQQDGGSNGSTTTTGTNNAMAIVYPLFMARTVEREQLERGLTLLGANVDCILMTYRMEYTPKSHILARLKRIYDHVVIEGNANANANALPSCSSGVVVAVDKGMLQ
jgi:hypothetical protein